MVQFRYSRQYIGIFLNRFLLSVGKDGKDGWIETWKSWVNHSSFNAKSAKKYYGLYSLIEFVRCRIHNSTGAFCVWVKALFWIKFSIASPKVAISSWHSLFNTTHVQQESLIFCYHISQFVSCFPRKRNFLKGLLKRQEGCTWWFRTCMSLVPSSGDKYFCHVSS